MKVLQFIILACFFIACKDAKKFVAIDGLFADTFIASRFSDTLTFSRVDSISRSFEKSELYIVIQLKLKYYDEEGWSLQHSGSIEPGLNGSLDSIIAIRFLNNKYEYLNPLFESFDLTQSYCALESIYQANLQSSWNAFSSPAMFVQCFNERSKKCCGVNLISPIVFKLKQGATYRSKDIPRFAEIFMSSGKRHLSSGNFKTVSLID